MTFDEWTQDRAVTCLGTNTGAPELPFQSWRHFKEAFAPELIARAVAESEIPVRRCLDPFGGSGTTALACQFLGIHPTIIEVNPFLADLIEAKLTAYDPDALARDLGAIVRSTGGKPADYEAVFKAAPATFVEPGLDGRWIFDSPVASRIATLLAAINELADERHRRLFRVLLGGILIDVSNVVISGKGRRYRRRWDQHRRSPHEVNELFCETARRAILELHRYSDRTCSTFDVLLGDCREILKAGVACDLSVFSPPYPNSFDYTDVYNVELWTLGYLTDARSNHILRCATLCSHVQMARDFPPPPSGSQVLDRVLDHLEKARDRLWSRWIPAMVGGYFAEVAAVLARIHHALRRSGSVWMVVGDSRYTGVHIKTAEIIAELAPSVGYQVCSLEPFRSMRASAQQGGRPELAEALIVLSKG